MWGLCYFICCRASIWWQPRGKAFGTKFNEKSPVSIFEERVVFFAPLNKKKINEIKELFGAARYMLYLSKAIPWGRYGRGQRKLYNSLLQLRGVRPQKIWEITFSICQRWKKQFFRNVLHVNDRLCFTFDIKCILLLNFY